MENLKIAIGSDHAGYPLKSKIVDWLKENGTAFKDFGTNSEDSVDYPDFAHVVAQSVEEGSFDCGILVCGSGIGVDMAANKHKGIRSALCWNKEVGKLAKQHNNANVICLPGRFIDLNTAKDILNAYFEAEFEGGRHQDRVNKISC